MVKSQEGNEMQQLVFAGTQVKAPAWLSSAGPGPGPLRDLRVCVAPCVFSSILIA